MRLSADWHWETDAELRFTWVSQDLASLVKLGVQPSDLLGHRIDAVPVFEPPAEGWAALNQRLAEHKPVRELLLEVRRAGRMSVWVALNARAHRDEQGRFTGYEGVGRDITEQHLAFVRLAESERRHALMAELSVDWYWQTDAEHRLEQFGPVARDLLGERANEAIGQTRWALASGGRHRRRMGRAPRRPRRAAAVSRLRVRRAPARAQPALGVDRRSTAPERPRRIHRLSRRRQRYHAAQTGRARGARPQQGARAAGGGAHRRTRAHQPRPRSLLAPARARTAHTHRPGGRLGRHVEVARLGAPGRRRARVAAPAGAGRP